MKRCWKLPKNISFVVTQSTKYFLTLGSYEELVMTCRRNCSKGITSRQENTIQCQLSLCASNSKLTSTQYLSHLIYVCYLKIHRMWRLHQANVLRYHVCLCQTDSYIMFNLSLILAFNTHTGIVVPSFQEWRANQFHLDSVINRRYVNKSFVKVKTQYLHFGFHANYFHLPRN